MMTNCDSVRTVDSLGRPTFRRKPDRANLSAGIVISGLLMCGGGFIVWRILSDVTRANWQLPIYAERGVSWTFGTLGCLLGSGLMIGGTLLGRWVWRMFPFEFFVCPEGFYYTQNGEPIVFAWDEIVEVCEHIQHEHVPLKGPFRSALPTKNIIPDY